MPLHLLRSEGVEVLYMEKLVAEALDACPSARAEFTDTFMAESGIVNPMLEQAVREKARRYFRFVSVCT